MDEGADLVTALAALLGALVGGGVGAFAAIQSERLRGRHELALRRREEIRDDLRAIYRLARTMGAEHVARSYRNLRTVDEIRDPMSSTLREIWTRYYDIELLIGERTDLRQAFDAFAGATENLLGPREPGEAPRSGHLDRKVLADVEVYDEFLQGLKNLRRALGNELNRL